MNDWPAVKEVKGVVKPVSELANASSEYSTKSLGAAAGLAEGNVSAEVCTALATSGDALGAKLVAIELETSAGDTAASAVDGEAVASAEVALRSALLASRLRTERSASDVACTSPGMAEPNKALVSTVSIARASNSSSVVNGYRLESRVRGCNFLPNVRLWAPNRLRWVFIVLCYPVSVPKMNLHADEWTAIWGDREAT